MTEKKKRRGIFDDLFGFSLFDEIDSMFENLLEGFGEGSSGGYSIQVVYTDEGPVVYAELSDNMDAEQFRKMLEQKYPGAKIVIKGGKQEEKFKVVEKTTEKRVEIKLEETGEENRGEEEEKSEESVFDMLYGKRKTFIRRED